MPVVHRSLTLSAICFFFSVIVLGVQPANAALARAPRYERAPCPSGLPALAQAHCGFLIVPESRVKINSPTIKVAVAILPSVAAPAKSDPLVYLGGGPGGVPFLETPALLAAGFNRERDLILVEQRGTLYSQPALTCPVIDAFNEQLIGLRYDAESTRRLHIAATSACRRQLLRKGVDIAAYNTAENAADFADLRRVLGYRSWNVFGVSYGTDLAQVLMRDHPGGIRSVVLDSTVPTHVVRLSAFWSNARFGLDNLSAACTAQPACRNHYPNVEAKFLGLVRTLERKPLVTSIATSQQKNPVRIVLDGGALVNWLVTMSLFGPQFIDVPAWIAELAAGNPTNIAESRAVVTPPGYVGYGLAFGVICSEWFPFDSERATIAAGHGAFPDYPLSVVAQAPQFPYFFDDCRVWKVPPALPAARAPAQDRIPTLIVSGSFDGITSLRWAQDVARFLPHSRIIDIPGAAHSVLPKSSCAQAAMASFLDRPQAPNTGCVASLKPPNFSTP